MVKVTTPGAWGASALELPGLTGPSGEHQRMGCPLMRGFDIWTCCITTPSALPPPLSNTIGADRADLMMAASLLGYFSSDAEASPPFALVTFRSPLPVCWC